MRQSGTLTHDHGTVAVVDMVNEMREDPEYLDFLRARCVAESTAEVAAVTPAGAGGVTTFRAINPAVAEAAAERDAVLDALVAEIAAGRQAFANAESAVMSRLINATREINATNDAIIDRMRQDYEAARGGAGGRQGQSGELIGRSNGALTYFGHGTAVPSVSTTPRIL